MVASSLYASGLRTPRAKLLLVPVGMGIVAALIMLSVYLGILTALQSFDHALEQLANDGVFPFYISQRSS